MSPPTRKDLGRETNNGFAVVFAFFDAGTGGTTVFLAGGIF